MKSVCLAASAAVAASFTVNPMNDHIQVIHEKGISTLDRAVPSAVWLYHPDSATDSEFKSDYNTLAEELKENIRVMALDCSEHAKFCKSQNYGAAVGADGSSGEAKPHVVIYPVNPMPVYRYQGDLSKISKLKAHIVKQIPTDLVTIVTKENVDTFVTTAPTMPKVLVFSKSKKPSYIFTGLSQDTVFRRTIKFAFVSAEENEVIAKYKGLVKESDLPAVIMVRGAKAEKKEKFKGKVFGFLELKEWINTFSESGMGDKLKSSSGGAEESAEEARPWLSQEVPEMTGPSHHDVCLKGEGLCVIYLSDGALAEDKKTMLTGLKDRFTSQLSGRGTTFKWMWMDMKVEEKFHAMFDPAGLPGVVVFNPHKRLRFTKSEVESVEEKDITNLIDKIQGGDARFKMVKGQKLPSWAKRDAAKAKEEL